MKLIFLFFIVVLVATAQAQIYIQRGANVHLAKNAAVYVEGDITSFNSIEGNGNIILSGQTLQRINFNGSSLPNLQLFNAHDVELNGDLSVARSLTIKDGMLNVGKYSLILGATAKIEMLGKGGILTGEMGFVRKYISSDLDNYLVPLVNKNGIAAILLTTSGRYHHAYADISSVAKAPENLPQGIDEYDANYWILNHYGIDGEMNATTFLPSSSVDNPATNVLSAFARNSNRWTTYGPQSRGQLVYRHLKSGESVLAAMSVGRRLSLSLAPNPARDYSRLTVVSDPGGRAEILVVDARGRILTTRSMTLVKGLNNVMLNISGFANGSYDIVVNQPGNTSTLKLIKL